MYQNNFNRISVKTILDRRYKKKNGLYSVKVQVIYMRVQKYYNTGKELSETDWERLPHVRIANLVKLRNAIKSSFDLIYRVVEELGAKGQFSFDNLDIMLKASSGNTLNTCLKNKIEFLRKDERIGTMLFYKAVLTSLEKYAGKDIFFESINMIWLKKYETHLLNKKMKYATIGMYMRGIRAAMNQAKKDGIINESQYPFGRNKYEIRTGTSIKKALTLQQIAKFVKYTDGNTNTEFYRDLWFFIYLCNGINIADLVKLKFSNICDGEIYFIREKTKRTSRTIKNIRVVITPEMETIIEKWGNKRIPNNYIFNLINYTTNPEKHKTEVLLLTKRMNQITNMIGKSLGLGNITTYTARHSYATVLKRSGVSISYISESLGHNNIKTTESYLASFDREDRDDNAKLLTKFKIIDG